MNIQTNTHIHTNAKIKIHKLNIHKCKHLIKRHEYEYTCCISLMPRNKYKEKKHIYKDEDKYSTQIEIGVLP